MTESVHSMLFSIIGIIVILGIAFALSSGKRHISLRVVGAAFGLQAFMALLVLRTDVGIEVIKWLSSGVSALLGYGNAGTDFLLGAGRPQEVLQTLGGRESVDSLLLRLTEAATSLKRPQAQDWQRTLQDRYAAARARGDTTHLGEEARFELQVRGDAGVPPPSW